MLFGPLYFCIRCTHKPTYCLTLQAAKYLLKLSTWQSLQKQNFKLHLFHFIPAILHTFNRQRVLLPCSDVTVWLFFSETLPHVKREEHAKSA